MTGKKPFAGADYKQILRSNKACTIDFQDHILKNVNSTSNGEKSYNGGSFQPLFYKSFGSLEENALCLPTSENLIEKSITTPVFLPFQSRNAKNHR